jgi:hypothetical protein
MMTKLSALPLLAYGVSCQICKGEIEIQNGNVGCTTLYGKLKVTNSASQIIQVKQSEEIKTPLVAQKSEKSSKEINLEQVALEISHNLEAQTISIQDLGKMEGDMYVFDNTALVTLDFPELKEINGRILLTANKVKAKNPADTNNTSRTGPSLQLPKLQKATGNISLYDINSLDMSSLTELNGDLRVQRTMLSNITLPSLQEMKSTGTFSIQNNTGLTSLSFPNLTEMSGSLIVIKNQRLNCFEGDDISKLQKVHGNIWLSCIPTDPQSPLDGFKALKFVRGSMKLEIPGVTEADCAKLKEKFKDSKIVEGKFQCASEGIFQSLGLMHSISLWKISAAVAFTAIVQSQLQ